MKKQIALLLLLGGAGVAAVSMAESTPGENSPKPVARIESLNRDHAGGSVSLSSPKGGEGRGEEALKAQGEKKPPVDVNVPALRSEVTELRARVQTLEERTRRLESTVEKLTQPPHLMPLNSPERNPLLFKAPSVDSRPPQIWGEREVNGWTFYIVLCEQSSH